jgi:glycosyltransferase involved in cell wall biosynthesis
MTKLKILVVSESISSDTGGGRSGILGVCSALMKCGHDITLITSGLDEIDIKNPSGINIVEHIKVLYFKPFLTLLGTSISFSALYYLFRQVKKYDLVLVHSLYKVHSTFASFVSYKYKIPYIIRPHGTLDLFLISRRRSFLKKLFINYFEKKNFYHASAIQFSSELEKKNAKKFISIFNSIIVPEGINQEAMYKRKVSYEYNHRFKKINSNQINIIYLGRFHEKKGLFLLINGFSYIAAKFPRAKLILAGSGDSEYTKKVNDLIIKTNLGSQISVTGFLNESDKLSLLNSADIFALPSYGENFGLSVVEAMSFSIPVVISDKVGIFEAVNDAQAGFIVKCNANSVARALEKLVSEKSLRYRLGKNAKKLSEEKYNLANMGQIMSKFYIKLVNENKKSKAFCSE